jgi:hypothetical protein
VDGIFDEDAFNFFSRVSRGTVTSSVIESGDPEYWDTRAANGAAPKVYAIDPLSCDGATCAEGPENAITLNGKNQGDQESINFFAATVKFYAAADADQLPLRRVVVDWGDGRMRGRPSFSGDFDSADNYFKNARGFVQGTTTPICSTNDEWGKTPESCSASYFQSSHVYTCSGGASTLPSCSTLAPYQRDADGTPRISCYDSSLQACVFRPRVHVRDNWGFCSGICRSPLSGDGTASCYAGDENTLLREGDTNDECNIKVLNDVESGIQNRTGRGVSIGEPPSDPWVYYDGAIIVK